MEVSKWHRERFESVHRFFFLFFKFFWPCYSCLVFWGWPYRWTKIKNKLPWYFRPAHHDMMEFTLLQAIGNFRWIIPGAGKPVFRNSQCIPGNLRLCGRACSVAHSSTRSILLKAVSVSPVGCLYNQTPLFSRQPGRQVPYKQSSLKWWYSAFSSSFLNWMS